MNYPYKVGGGVMPAPRLSQFKNEEHEYLVADREVPMYRGHFNWLGTEAEVSVENEFKPVTEPLKCLEDFCRNAERHAPELRKFAAQHALAEANETMRDEIDEPWTEETLAAELTIQSVEMCFGGFYSVYYTIGDYTICVDGDENGPEKVWFDRTD